MKNYILAFVTGFATVLGSSAFIFGADCSGGFCHRPVGRVVTTTKTVAREVVRLPRKVVTKCVNGRCNRAR